MLKLLSIILLSIFFVESSIAAITPKQELKLILDELEYSLKVEWDQKDKKFAEEKLAVFNERLKVLYTKGLSKDDLISGMSEGIKDEAFKKELSQLQVQLKLSSLSFEETRALMKDAYSRSLARGASWSGNADQIILGAVIGFFVVTLVALIISSEIRCNKDPNSCVSDSSDDDSSSSDSWDDDSWSSDDNSYYCEDEYVCDDYFDGTSYCYTTTYCY